MDKGTPIQEAVVLAGTQALLGKMIGRRQSTISDWVRRGWPDPEACVALEEATGGKIKAIDFLSPALKRKRKRARAAA